MRIQNYFTLALLTLCCIPHAYGMGDNENTQGPPIVTGGWSQPLQVNEKFALQDIRQKLNLDNDEEAARYVKTFEDIKESWIYKQESQTEPIINNEQIRETIRQNGGNPDEETVNQLSQIYKKWTQQGIASMNHGKNGYQEIPNAQKPHPKPSAFHPVRNKLEEHKEHRAKNAWYNLGGTPALYAYDILRSPKTHRLVGGCITGACSSWGGAAASAQLTHENDSVWPLITSALVSTGVSLLGSAICKNDSWFYSGYTLGHGLGHVKFHNDITSNTTSATPLVNKSPMHTGAAVGPALLAIKHAGLKTTDQ